MDDGQSGSLGGDEDSSLAPRDRHHPGQRFFVLAGTGQALSVDQLPEEIQETY